MSLEAIVDNYWPLFTVGFLRLASALLVIAVTLGWLTWRGVP